MITTKQRAYLRGLANKVPALYQVGKGGVSENFIKMILDSLEKNELIKITVLENTGCTTREICNQVVALTDAEPVQVIGGKFVIYKPSQENPTIVLPK